MKVLETRNDARNVKGCARTCCGFSRAKLPFQKRGTIEMWLWQLQQRLGNLCSAGSTHMLSV
eukprot:1358516-Amphidinium_carterae.1